MDNNNVNLAEKNETKVTEVINAPESVTAPMSAPAQQNPFNAAASAPVASAVPVIEQVGEKKKGRGNAFITVMLVLVVLMLAASIGLLVYSMKKNEAANKRFDELNNAIKTVAETADSCKADIDAANETLVEISEFTTSLSSKIGGEFGETTEDGVIIGMEYEIVSTRALSDAYLAGDWSHLTEDEQETIELAAEVIDEVIEDGMTDYEKEVAIYDWMFENIKHDDGITVAIPTTGNYCDNPHGVLLTHKAVCVGFATTFRLFMHMLDIECMVVHDTYLSHSWDLVKIGDGWYHTDLYMDAEGTRYANFNMTDEICYQSNDWDMSFYPAANSTEYCYSVMSAVEFESLQSAAQDIRELVEGEEGRTLTYKITGDDMYTVYQQLELMVSEADYYVMNSDISDYGYLYYQLSFADDDALYYSIQFEVYYYNDDYNDYEDYEELSDREYDQAYRIIEEAFEDFYESHEEYDYYDDYYEDYYEDEEFYSDYEEYYEEEYIDIE